MTFTKWLKTKEGFNSRKHYDLWLSKLSLQDKKITDTYYHEKYLSFLNELKLENEDLTLNFK